MPLRIGFSENGSQYSGLITGQDLEAQLKGRDLGEVLLLPEKHAEERRTGFSG